MDAASWSAVAAFFSAVVAAFAYRMQREQDRRQQAPNLSILGLYASIEGDQMEITLGSLHNHGPGHARTVFIFGEVIPSPGIGIQATGDFIGWLPANQSVGLNHSVHALVVPSAPAMDGAVYARGLRVTIGCWDSIRRRHLFIHNALIVGDQPPAPNAAPQIQLRSIVHKSASARAIRTTVQVGNVLKKVPGLRAVGRYLVARAEPVALATWAP